MHHQGGIPTKRDEVWYTQDDWKIFTKFKHVLPDGQRHEHMRHDLHP